MKSPAHINLHRNPEKLSLLMTAATLLGWLLGAMPLYCQSTDPSALPKKMQDLSDSIAKAQSQIDESQRQLQHMREQLSTLEQQFGITPIHPEVAATQPPENGKAVELEDIKERQDMQASQIATLSQEKVESDSKYPIKLTGLILFTGFSNSTRMDMAATPTSALFGSGSTGATVRQTILGVDARGPHILGAATHADLRVDFDGDPASSAGTTSYPGSYNANATVLRLRTGHAALDWSHTSIFFSLDRPILSPDTPTSLTAVAEPPLAWSGNLWSWNPQVGVERYMPANSRSGILVQAALIDVSDAPQTLAYRTKVTSTPLASGAEQRMRPGGELRLAWTGKQHSDSPHLGLGGYFGPHTSTTSINFNAWAITADLKINVAPHLEFTGSGYRGQALGGLGGGAYKDYVSGTRLDGESYFQSLDDVGGWTQLKEKLSERLQFNEAFGMDQVFAKELNPFAGSTTQGYLNFARNRTWTTNVIYSPSAYLLFSFEYRRVETAPIAGRLWNSNVYGVAAGYRF
jgi:uncharacterized coiled-coil protein SlyX